MALEDPTAPPPMDIDQSDPWSWVPPHWVVPQEVTASTLGPRGGSADQAPVPVLPPPMPTTSTLGPRGRNNLGEVVAAPQDELATPTLPPPADQPAHTPAEEAQIQIDAPVTAPGQTADEAPVGMPTNGPVTSPSQVEAVPVTSPSEVDPNLYSVPPEHPLPETGGPANGPVTSPNDVDPNLALDEQARVNAMNPVEREQYRSNLNDAKLKRAQFLKDQADAKLLEDQHDELLYRQQAAKDAEQSAQARAVKANQIANTLIDPNRWSKNQSVGQSILSVIAATVGGAMSAGTGGRNLALEQINKAIDNDIAAQKDNITNQWRGLEQDRIDSNDKYSKAQDVAQAMQTYRQGAYLAAIKGIDTQMQDYAPNSTTALRLADVKNGVLRELQMQDAAARQQDFKNGVDYRKSVGDFMKAQAEAAKLAAETAKIRGQLGGVGAGKDKLTIPQLAARYPGSPLPPASAFPQGLTENEFATWLETGKKGQESLKATRENDMQDQGTLLRNPITQEPLLDKNNKPIHAGSVEIADKANGKIATAQNLTDFLSKIRRQIDSDPASIDRAAWQTITSDYEQAKVAYIESHDMKASSREMQAVEEMFGTNFDSFRSRISERGKARATIDSLLNGTQQSLDNDIGTKYGAKVRLLDTSKPPPAKKTPDEEKSEKLSTNLGEVDQDSLSQDDRDYNALQIGGRGASVLELKNAGWSPQQIAERISGSGVTPESLSSPTMVRALSTGIAPSKLRILDELYADANGANPEAKKKALAILGKQSQSGRDQATRQYARKILQDVSDDVNTETLDKTTKAK